MLASKRYQTRPTQTVYILKYYKRYIDLLKNKDYLKTMGYSPEYASKQLRCIVNKRTTTLCYT